jgi:hypothetical protein
MPIKDFLYFIARPQPTHKLAKSDPAVAATSGRPSVAARIHRHSPNEVTAGGTRFGKPSRPIVHHSDPSMTGLSNLASQ